ncbi:MAG: RNA-splicing ligase RtcB, partial [Planctomycetia bacterium 21-64-5]
VRSNLFYQDVKPHLTELVEEMFRQVPTGVGRSGKYRFDARELKRLMAEGPSRLVERSLAVPSDIDHTEARGRLDGAEPDNVSERALERGKDQCGTLGSGNHFMEVQVVDAVFDDEAARSMGLAKDMVCVMIHSGSRGLGYQVCDDALRLLRGVPEKYGIDLPDRQLACAPVESREGEHYLGTMRAAANYAWCNRQLLMWQARETFETIFGRPWEELQMNLVYDVAHNIAKFEEHTIGGRTRRLWVVMSRTAAIKHAQGRRIDQELKQQGIIARARSWKGLAEEQPAAYKDVSLVVEVVHQAGLAKKVARMRPIGVIKG